jgi:hypothetical protein
MVRGGLDRKLRQTSRFVQMHSGAPAMLLWARMPQTIIAEIRPGHDVKVNQISLGADRR